MTDLLELLIYESFKTCGKDDRKAAKLAAESVRKAKIVVEARIDRAERDRRIYELRATMTESQLAERFSLSTRRIKQIVHEQHLSKRRIA